MTIEAKVIKQLNELKDPKRIAFAEKTFPTAMEMIGVTNPNMKKVVLFLKKETKNYSFSEKHQLSLHLIRTNIFECQFVVYEWLGRDKKYIHTLNEKLLSQLLKNLDNWVSVDTLSMGLLGTAWRLNKVSDSFIKKLLVDEDFWLRRAGLVATVGLNLKSRGGTGDAKRTIWACEFLINDHEKMIVKAMSWALRELIKHDVLAVKQFLIQHDENLHKTIKKEVGKKLKTIT